MARTSLPGNRKVPDYEGSYVSGARPALADVCLFDSSH